MGSRASESLLNGVSGTSSDLVGAGASDKGGEGGVGASEGAKSESDFGVGPLDMLGVDVEVMALSQVFDVLVWDNLFW